MSQSTYDICQFFGVVGYVVEFHAQLNNFGQDFVFVVLESGHPVLEEGDFGTLNVNL